MLLFNYPLAKKSLKIPKGQS